MKKINFFKIFMIMGAINEWLMKASADGVISAKEGLELIETLCAAMGWDFDKAGIKVE